MNGDLRDAWLSEMWKPCRELPIGERLEKREDDAVQQALLAVDEPPENVERGAA